MNERLPILKQIDIFVFKKIDEFRGTPSYSKLLESYTSLEENEQKVAKGVLLGATALIPILLLFTLWLTNRSTKNNLETRTELVMRMQEIISQNGAAGNLVATMASPTPISDQSQLNNRMSNIASSTGVDANKLKVSNFSTETVSPILTKSEADFKFEALSTAQLMSLLTAMLGRERFRVSSVNIKRNNISNMLEGTFHAIHFGQTPLAEDNE